MFVLIIASLVAFIDRQVVAIVVEPMQKDLNVGDTEIGWLYGVFALFYAFAAIPIATIADKKSRKHVIAIGIFVWSLMTIACGLTKNYWQIFLARIGVGIGEATLSPTTTSLLGDYFPREDLPLAISIFQAGPIVGTGIAFVIGGMVLQLVGESPPLVLPYFGELAPWQQTFVYLGLPGILLSVMILVIREPRRRPFSRDPQSSSDTEELINFYKRNFKTIFFHHLRESLSCFNRVCVRFLEHYFLCQGTRNECGRGLPDFWLDFHIFWAHGTFSRRLRCQGIE